MLAPSPSQQSEQLPYGLVSLWDMLNFKVGALLELSELLGNRRQAILGGHRLRDPSEPANALLVVGTPSTYYDAITPKIVSTSEDAR